MAMSSSRPYLVRALYEWIVDNEFTPHVVVNASAPNTEVPQQYVNKDGQIVLNIAPRAVDSLELGNRAINFNARFGGIPTNIYVPISAVLGIYARENGQGMMFEQEKQLDSEPRPEPASHNVKEKNDIKRPSLKLVK